MNQIGGTMRFTNRTQAGILLAQKLAAYAGRRDVVVLALPRGGVPVAFEIARALEAPLDILLVRKLGVPGHEEYAMGAIASGGVCILQSDVIRQLEIPQAVVDALVQRKLEEMAQRERLYRSNRPAPKLEGNIVILVDDGLATGSTMLAAIHALRQSRPARMIIAIPVGARESIGSLQAEVDEIVCLSIPEYFQAVGMSYKDFNQTSDDEVIHLLDEAARLLARGRPAAEERKMRPAHNQLMGIQANGVHMEGMLELPEDAVGIVLFAHGSGSSRLSPRNNFVARYLHQARIGTLLLDLLTMQEDRNYATRFDIALLTRRLSIASDWLGTNDSTTGLPLGLFGASTGAAAALQVAAARGTGIAAVVSRGGRPDLAGLMALQNVSAPTLLIVGGNDGGVIELNQSAYAALRCEKKLEIVPGATHLFEEPGTLEKVAELASAWFTRHLTRPVSAGQ